MSAEWEASLAKGPQPAADERVAEHMRLVAAYGAQVQRDAFSGASLTLKLDAQEPDYSRIVAVEQSARALLSASQEDAGRQARLVELVLHMAESKRLRDWEDFHIDLSEAISIAKALKEPK